jgi:hypothetical protein
VGLAYARPLLADDQDAEPLFDAALGADLARWSLVRARLLLAYGAWLRRRWRGSPLVTAFTTSARAVPGMRSRLRRPLDHATLDRVSGVP